ncbi:cysteine proteinase [Macrolepiota fuliginosa MF-IS2]|uniref:ubiquitinyl hydrolase 1 n=1 Tax=Macrolepiota fuliginosa MF-IS2 TaxID=1400762 RepID=A0A9P5XP55_9AGAR|nr:cysteine proteinase [Macrolepiota fuliginosa MF-IS2]
MPGVTLLSNTPSISGLDSPSTDKYSPYANMSVADIKTRVRETVLKEANRASPISLVHIARNQILSAKERETTGDLHGALESYIKAATLIKMTMDSAEFKQEKTRGVLRKEVNDFLSGTGQDLRVRTQNIEERLKSFEAGKQSNNTESNDKGVNKAPGGSIADRMRALQDNGLSINPTKRISREIPNLSNPPLSPSRPSTNSVQPSPSTVLSGATPSTSTSASQSAHTFVPASSFGPPSPASSPSNSPQLNTNFDISGFTNFPSIDELDENPAFSLPSVPTGVGVISSKPSLKDIRNGDVPPSPSTAFKNLALNIERPSSTPITPTMNAFNSGPPSPTRGNAPHKPSGLSSSTTPTSTSQPSPAKPPIPNTGAAFPRELLTYMRDYNILVIDVRNRADFDREHIKARAIVCIEPSVLMREKVTADTLEDSMIIAPKGEANLFSIREKFDLVAVCDESSTTFSSCDSPLSVLVRVIYEQAFRKILKRMPMLLVGGIEAWKRDVGGAELVYGEAFGSAAAGLAKSSAPPNDQLVAPLSPVPSLPSTAKNPFLNGIGATSSPMGSPSINEMHTGTTSFNPFRSMGVASGEHRSNMSLDQTPSHSRLPAEVNYTGNSVTSNGLQRRSAVIRPSISQNGTQAQSPTPPTLTNGTFTQITYPQFPPRRISPTTSGNGSASRLSITLPPGSPFVSPPDIASPPPASINPSSAATWRRNDYLDQTHEAFLGYNQSHPHTHARQGPIDYPELLPIRPPPVAAQPALERQDNRPRVPVPAPSHGPVPTSASAPLAQPGLNGAVGMFNGVPKPPRIDSDFPVTYWSDIQIGLSGLKNLGNTCYMNAPIQCLSATVPFSRFFTEHRWKNAINFTNPLGSKGRLTGAFAKLLHEMWGGDLPYLTPIEFRKSICQLRLQYDNSDQHDSQEFLSFLMDGIHEDLNRVIVKPAWAPTPEQEAELERLPVQVASEREWKAWRARNDSLIVDYFQGQFRNRLQCLTCGQTSTTYNVFSILQLPIPHGRNGRVPIERCLDAFFNEEILEKDDAWDCPRCKTKRRASKKLSLARLPPVLLIHLKRFEANGRFSDKVDTFVEFPMKALDLTNYMPAPLPPGADKSELNGGLPMSLDDPRTQLPPYRYDLYGVTNHYGNLTSGHYTAFVSSRGGWMYCDDSSVKAVETKQVVNQKAYVLFYKRARS